MCNLLGETAVAKRFLLSGMPNDWRALASDAGPVGLYSMPSPNIRDGWYDHGKDEDTADDLVRSRLASDNRKKRTVGQDTGTDAWHQLSNGMDDASAVPRVDGS